MLPLEGGSDMPDGENGVFQIRTDISCLNLLTVDKTQLFLDDSVSISSLEMNYWKEAWHK